MLKKLLCCLALNGCTVITDFGEFTFYEAGTSDSSILDGSIGNSDSTIIYDGSDDSMVNSSNDGGQPRDGGLLDSSSDSNGNWASDSSSPMLDSGFDPYYDAPNCFNKPCEDPSKVCTTIACPIDHPGICRRCL